LQISASLPELLNGLGECMDPTQWREILQSMMMCFTWNYAEMQICELILRNLEILANG
jgi:hypothetical protein